MIPTATYRLQFNGSFTFEHALGITEYLHALGISHVYASSYLKAVPGSTHGYDVVDPTQLNPEIGNPLTHAAWVEGLRGHGMGHILDLVPNHMGIAQSANPWWQDVLENGPNSRHAAVFDIDWHPLKTELERKVLLPVLGGSYGAVLERQEIRLEYAHGAFCARYFDHVFPLAPRSYARVLGFGLDVLLARIGLEDEAGMELLSIMTALRHLPDVAADDPGLRAERDREKQVVKRRLAALTTASADVRAHIDRAITTLNGEPGDPGSFDALDDILSNQYYRLAHWQVAAEEINYRRFFDINDLAAIRMEDPHVFEQTHAFVFDLVGRGLVDGFRIDHVDGLYDPGDYLTRLNAHVKRPVYLVVEKILGADEQLPAWPVDGTTGYEFLTAVNGLFVNRHHERAMREIYERFSRMRMPFAEIAYRGKQLILRVSMPSELNVLAHRLNRFSERSRHYRDFTLNSLTQAMREIIACFPVYRSYVNEREDVSERDRAYITRAVREAKRRNPNRPVAVYDFVGDLLLKHADYLPARERPGHMRFLGQFQQVTSPVTAKGIEDTALYIYNLLVSLNEVGGEPERFGTAPDTLHHWLAGRAIRGDHGLSTTSTHDTKRSEDVRARINVLSDMPEVWRAAATRWARLNRRGRSIVDDASYPSRNEEYLLYQTLLGTWPSGQLSLEEEAQYRARIVAYMTKAMREAKVYTSWLNPSREHEDGMTRFVEFVLDPQHTAFREDFLGVATQVARHGVYNSLAQQTIKMTAPGVPDLYQGTELWDFSLVDPDNRRPVDYERRAALLAALDEERERIGLPGLVSRLAGRLSDDRAKLYVTSTLLRFRRAHAELFERGVYEPVPVGGAQASHVFAFARVLGDTRVLTVVPRLTWSLVASPEIPPLGDDVWGDTQLHMPALSMCNVLTGQRVTSPRLADVLRDLPVAVLEVH